MIVNSNSVSKNSTLEVDICVIGAGAAGLPLAHEFLGSNKKVCILESGLANLAPRYQALNEIECTELPVAIDSRIRGFGGTTKVWAGRWLERDEIDFEERVWVPLSGWSISKAELVPYYKRGAKIFGIANLNQPVPNLGLKKIQPIAYKFVKNKTLDFGGLLKKQFENDKNFSVYLDANAVNLEKSGNKVQKAWVRSLNGNEFTVKAQVFVLAAGGIENPRLLLISNLGNEHDQVGRYYMDHPKGKLGIVATYQPMKLATWMGLRLTDEIQRELRILNSHIFLEVLPELSIVSRIKRKLGVPMPARFVAIRNYMEQAPSPENRVGLSEHKDALGLPKAEINWQISDMDKRTMVYFHKILQEEFRALKIGELDSPLLGNNNFENWPINQDASHHMGTTRMGKDPATSVVDKNCKVHGFENLFIAGSSVFPTGGYANPVATIVALALRLADYIKTRI